LPPAETTSGVILSAMSSGPQIESSSTRVKKSLLERILFYTGIVIYAGSFFLPAVNADVGGPLLGWACAWLAFFTLHEIDLSSLAFFGAWINPIAIVYLVLRILNRVPRVRIGLAAAILIFIPLTWLALFKIHYTIRVGHVAWIAGLLLMISWTDFRRSSKPQHSVET